MRSGWIGALVGLVVAGLASGAAAVPVPYNAEIDLYFGLFAPPVAAIAVGTVEIASDGSFTLPAGVLQVAQTATAPQTGLQFFSKARFDFHNGTGMFGGPAHPGGPMPLLGKVQLFAKPALSFPTATLPLTQGFSGGVASTMVSNGASVATLALEGTGTGRWRVGMVTQYSSTPSSTFTYVSTGSDTRTAQGARSLNLVIPVSFRRSLDGAFREQNAVTGILTITFTPEPSQLLLEGGSAAALVLLGATRARARSVQR